jgi:hypothetical protein
MSIYFLGIKAKAKTQGIRPIAYIKKEYFHEK